MKSVITCCHWVAASHAKNKGATGYAGQEVFIGTEKFGLGEWYLQAVKSGAYASIRHDLFVDLRLPLENIWSSLRKSYKSLINSGSKIWINSIQKSGNEDIWEEFELLHREAAGRRTRSKKTWDIQHEAVASGQAFLVYLRDKNKRMVGGGFFHTSKIEGVYAVGAYNRSLFANPIGHIVQWEAIMEMKRRGLLWYKIGTASYSGDCPEPTEKERSISHFKEGFATHHFAALRFECQVNRGDQEKCNDK
jgi:FemAB family protein